MKAHHYMERTTGYALQIMSARRPSQNTIPRSGTWIIREWDVDNQMFRVAGEITWGTVQKLLYLGATK